ncbi:MAG: hypothetical protein HFH95_07625 [Lachnospiraceae bacterium]|nr:hypothetical protein [uncultured Acetatifactor sp.]MCI8543166.1 hypothetical protein [Lachnospiraceae bacterium]
MKKIWRLYKPYMIRPVLYKGVTRCAVALAVILLWDRFVESPLSAARDGSAAAAVVLFLMGWISYLKLDGVRISRLPGKEKDRKSRQGSRGDIVDFVDEHVVSFDELEPEEQTACILAANLLSGLLFLGAALIAML